LPRRRNDTLSPLNAPAAPTTRAERHGDLLAHADLAPSGQDRVPSGLAAPREQGTGRRRTRTVPAPLDSALRELTSNKYLDVSLSRIKQVYT
ncbi:hypothetical protein K4G99_22825, partial [Mycobacterium tuberculosis]|nr:hypothetical protein [Mycobacterium tuberculosis]